jgi:peptidoglycan hydrolase-like amidase
MDGYRVRGVSSPRHVAWKQRLCLNILDLSGGAVLYAAQSNPQIDAEIAEKGRFRTNTNSGIRISSSDSERRQCRG